MCHLRGRFKVSSGAFKAGAAIRAAGQSALLTLVDNNTDNNNKNHHHRCVFFIFFFFEIPRGAQTFSSFISDIGESVRGSRLI